MKGMRKTPSSQNKAAANKFATRRSKQKSTRSINCIIGYLLVSLTFFLVALFVAIQHNPHWLDGVPVGFGHNAMQSLLHVQQSSIIERPLILVPTTVVSDTLPPTPDSTRTKTESKNTVASNNNEIQKSSKPKEAALPDIETKTKTKTGMATNIKRSKGFSEDRARRESKQKEAQRIENENEFKLRKMEEAFIQIMPTRGKPEIKQNRRVVLDKSLIAPIQRPPGAASGIQGRPRALIAAIAALEKHPLHALIPPSDPVQSSQLHLRRGHNATTDTLEGALVYMKNTDQCKNMPIFLTMANAGDELYWQLIENFVYTMAKFGVSDCAFVICVSDARCMSMCKESLFPCFDYRYTLTLPPPSVMEQIAAVKLYHIPKALAAGVNIFMLDLDVGFLQSPQLMVAPFQQTPTIDVFVQQDYLFIMNRTKAGWKSWFTEPLPNIGLFLCRGNQKVRDVFNIAWKKYLQMNDAEVKSNPGKDQNHVLEGMRIGRGTFGLRYAYFDNSTGALLDKIVQKYRNIELGGEAASHMLEEEHTVAMHTTCYEQSTKVMGLKATNAFWNPKYYDPLRPTLTKQILYISDEQVLNEMRSLVYLAISTKRALIIPNLLGDEAGDHGVTERYRGRAMWPGFRVMKLKRSKAGVTELKVSVLEPAFYWRVVRDYDDIPDAAIVYFDPTAKLTTVLKDLRKVKAARVILHAKTPSIAADPAGEDRLRMWASDSVGIYDSFAVEKQKYGQLPGLRDIQRERGVESVMSGMRNCQGIFGKLKGNRTCFQICD